MEGTARDFDYSRIQQPFPHDIQYPASQRLGQYEGSWGWIFNRYLRKKTFHNTLNFLVPYDQAEVVQLSLDYGQPAKKPKTSFFSRHLCAKQLLHALVNRTEAYGFAHRLGLIAFGTEVHHKCAPTSLLKGFSSALDNTEPDGDTCMLEAISVAAKKLVEEKDKLVAKGKEAPRLRIICISDGDDTCSKMDGPAGPRSLDLTAFHVAKELQESDVLLDAIMIGEDLSVDLRGLAKSSGGYAFHPKRLKDALKLCELETLLRAAERPPRSTSERRKVCNMRDFRRFSNSRHFPLDICDDETIPPRRQMPGTGQPVQVLHEESSLQPRTFHGPSFTEKEGLRRLMRELRELAKDPHASITVLPGEHDVSYWNWCASVLQPPSTKKNTFWNPLVTAETRCAAVSYKVLILHRIATEIGFWRCRFP